MIISAFYNKENECLTISSTNKVDNINIDDEIIKLVDKDNNVIGLNVFNSDINESGYVELSQINEEILAKLDTKELEPAFVYGEILSTEKHPKSDKLKICQVDLGDEKTQIVCGASNCEAGNIAVVAKVGAVMPNAANIVSSKLINVESNGMLCSTAELGFSKSNGIKLFDKGSKKLGSEVKRSDLK